MFTTLHGSLDTMLWEAPAPTWHRRYTPGAGRDAPAKDASAPVDTPEVKSAGEAKGQGSPPAVKGGELTSNQHAREREEKSGTGSGEEDGPPQASAELGPWHRTENPKEPAGVVGTSGPQVLLVSTPSGPPTLMSTNSMTFVTPPKTAFTNLRATRG